MKIMTRKIKSTNLVIQTKENKIFTKVSFSKRLFRFHLTFQTQKLYFLKLNLQFKKHEKMAN